MTATLTRPDEGMTGLVSLIDLTRFDRLTVDGVTDELTLHKERRDERDRDTITRGDGWLGCALMSPEEQAWTARADNLVFLLGFDDPAGCLGLLREHATTTSEPFAARYLAETGAKLTARAEQRAAARAAR